MVFSNYASEYGAQYASLNWWDKKRMMDILSIDSLHKVTSHVALHVDIRSGFHMNGTIDPFGAIRYLVARFGEGDDMEHIRRTYLRPMPCKGKMRPNVQIATYYTQLYLSLFGKTVKIGDWAILYDEVQDEANFGISVNMDLLTTDVAKECASKRNFDAMLYGSATPEIIAKCGGPTGPGWKQVFHLLKSAGK